MNITEKYNNQKFTLYENSDFVLVQVFKEKCETSDAWHNQYLGKVFVCFKELDMEYHSCLQVLDSNYKIYNSPCFIQIHGVNIAGSIIKESMERPINWNQYLQTIINETIR